MGGKGATGSYQAPVQMQDYPQNTAMRNLLSQFYQQQGAGPSEAYPGQLTQTPNPLLASLAGSLGSQMGMFNDPLSQLITRFSNPGSAMGWNPFGMWNFPNVQPSALFQEALPTGGSNKQPHVPMFQGGEPPTVKRKS